MGGRWGGAVLLATEFAPPHQRGFHGSFAQVGVRAGTKLSIPVYMTVLAVIAIACVWALTETYPNDMEDRADDTVSGRRARTSPP